MMKTSRKVCSFTKINDMYKILLNGMFNITHPVKKNVYKSSKNFFEHCR